MDLGSGFDTDDCGIVQNSFLNKFYCWPGVEKLIGNGGVSNHLYGNELNNALVGSDNDDQMEGGAGNDTFIARPLGMMQLLAVAGMRRWIILNWMFIPSASMTTTGLASAKSVIRGYLMRPALTYS